MSIPDATYLSLVRRLCDERDVLLIMDEVQTGLGRTGKLWGIQHFSVEPDIMVIGKGLAGGIYPISATCFRERCEAVFHADPFIHVSTFGGAEVACPVAMKVLEISADPALLDHVQEMAAFFAAGFRQLKDGHPEILVRLRQLGMMMGIELVNEQCGPLFSKAAYDAGFLSVYASNNPRVAQFLPPLTIEPSLAQETLERVDQALDGVERFLGL
jgi:acetylornithine/succinyldiaminopimelate/putrescine aminotransferase